MLNCSDYPIIRVLSLDSKFVKLTMTITQKPYLRKHLLPTQIWGLRVYRIETRRLVSIPILTEIAKPGIVLQILFVSVAISQDLSTKQDCAISPRRIICRLKRLIDGVVKTVEIELDAYLVNECYVDLLPYPDPESCVAEPALLDCLLGLSCEEEECAFEMGFFVDSYEWDL